MRPPSSGPVSCGTGGFADAALCLLEGAESAELQAISRVAEHRLARGIWTSPGAGDLRRALAAAQRLAILVRPPRSAPASLASPAMYDSVVA